MSEDRLTPKFRLGTTSFIYPDHIVPNVRKIGAVFDEIELLVFESLPEDVLPTADDVRTLAVLGRDLGLAYNVHLPVDVSLTAESARERQRAADSLARVLSRLSPLSPSTHTLHLPMEKGLFKPDTVRAWEGRARSGLNLLAPALPDPAAISVETLGYDPAAFEAIVSDYGFSVCADLGHHFKYGYDPDRTWEMFGDRISLIHLHGVDPSLSPPRDHLGLDRMPDDLFGRVTDLLAAYTGTVSIEVFGLPQLTSSLHRLGLFFDPVPDGTLLPAA